MKIVETLDAQKSRQNVDDNKQRIVAEFDRRMHDVWQYYSLESPEDIIAPIQLVTLDDPLSEFDPEELERLDESEVVSPYRDLLKENGLDLFEMSDLRWVVADARPISRAYLMGAIAAFLVGVLFFAGFGMLQLGSSFLGVTSFIVVSILFALLIVLGKRTNSQLEHEKVTSGGITYSEMKERLDQLTAQTEVANIDS